MTRRGVPMAGVFQGMHVWSSAHFVGTGKGREGQAGHTEGRKVLRADPQMPEQSMLSSSRGFRGCFEAELGFGGQRYGEGTTGSHTSIHLSIVCPSSLGILDSALLSIPPNLILLYKRQCSHRSLIGVYPSVGRGQNPCFPPTVPGTPHQKPFETRVFFSKSS